MKKKAYRLSIVLLLLSCITCLGAKTVKAEVKGSVTVTKETFDDYFGLRAATMDKTNGIITLTDGVTNNQFGSFYLKERMASSTDFTLKGKIYLGDKTDLKGGGDGVGFAFYPGEVGQLGYSGNGLGIAGVKNATGFKLDTYYNKKFEANPNGITAIGRLGYESDFPEEIGKNLREGRAERPFGGFLTTDGDEGYMTNDYDSIQLLNTNYYLTPSAESVPIEFTYSEGILYITLGEGSNLLTWQRKVDTKESFSFHVAASTGGNKNEQSFTFEKFVFSPVQKITVQQQWLDDEGVGTRPSATGFTLIQSIDGIEQTPTDKDHYDIEGGLWKSVIDDLPKYTQDGKTITYAIKADDVPHYDTVVLDNGDNTFTVTHTFRGRLALISVPESLLWKDRLIPRPGDILSRDSGNQMTIIVSDTRKEKSDWQVSASVNDDHSDLYSFIFKNTKNDTPVELNGKEVLNNTTAILLEDGTTYQADWSKETGVLLRANDYIPIGEYNKEDTITWNLVNAIKAK